MCGRFTHRYAWAEIQRLYRLTSPASNVQPSYNVCPTDTVNVVTSFQDIRILQPMRWGLIPRWWSKPLKDLMKLSTFNARVETVTTKPFFREAFKRTRCIIPASGYYEWQDTPGGKQPHYFTRVDGQVISFAGLWDEWKDRASGETVKSCTMITQSRTPWSRKFTTACQWCSSRTSSRRGLRTKPAWRFWCPRPRASFSDGRCPSA